LANNLELEKLNAELQAIKQSLKALVQRLDEIERSFREMPTETKAELSINPEDLEKLPWHPYREGHRAGWIFSDTEGAEELKKLLEESKKPLRIGNFSYKISHGETRDFISRRPLAEKKDDLPLHLKE